MPPRFLHLVDGTYELFRAHYSKRPEQTALAGWNAKATVGVVASLISLLADPKEDVTHMAVAFDNPFTSFRNAMFDGYKTGEGVEPALVFQLDRVEEAVRALGLPVWSMRDHEADDAMATGAHRFRDEVSQVRLMTPDKDLGQCIDGTRVVVVDRMRNRVLDEAALLALRGIRPRSVPSFLALTGDTADGIPGIPGFGEKTAAALLSRFETLDEIPDAASAWGVPIRGAERLAETLRERREDARLYEKLATLALDAPIDETLEAIRYQGTPRPEFHAWCDQIGITTLKDRPTRWA